MGTTHLPHVARRHLFHHVATPTPHVDHTLISYTPSLLNCMVSPTKSSVDSMTIGHTHVSGWSLSGIPLDSWTVTVHK